MADDKRPSTNSDLLKAGAVVGVVVVLIGAVVLDLRWVAYLALLGVVVAIGAIVIAVRARGGGAGRVP
ncbi:MAG: hypothetical protein M3370_04260 [Actinomycetota bacterium]|nr:hypothetical protein [Actinomycetota bacterium]